MRLLKQRWCHGNLAGARGLTASRAWPRLKTPDEAVEKPPEGPLEVFFGGHLVPPDMAIVEYNAFWEADSCSLRTRAFREGFFYSVNV